MNYLLLEKMVENQGRDKDCQNLLKETIENCKRERKTPKQALSKINELIINPTSIGVC